MRAVDADLLATSLGRPSARSRRVRSRQSPPKRRPAVAERLFWSGPAGTRPQSDHPAAFKIGGFEITVAAALSGAKLPPVMVNPRQIRDCAGAFGRLAKTHALTPR